MNTVSTNPGSYVDWNENPAKKKQNPTCLQKYTWILLIPACNDNE